MGGSGKGSRSFGRSSQPTGEPSAPPTPGIAGGGGGGGGGGQPDPCTSIDLNLSLQSPVPAIIPTLRKGDELKVKLTNNATPIVVETPAGKTAGAIVPPNIKQLVDCIKKGVSFVAEVLQVSGGAVKVRVRPE